MSELRPRALQVVALLSIPMWATLLPWIYNKRDPHLFDIPFFYWYQLLWVFISAITVSISYWLVIGVEKKRRAAEGLGAVKEDDR